MTEELKNKLEEYKQTNNDYAAGKHISWFLNHLWHDASERPKKLPIIHLWYIGNRISVVTKHEGMPMDEEIDDINFQPNDKWAYLEDLVPENMINATDDKLNLIPFLKALPLETRLYSPMYGNLWLAEVDEENEIITCYRYPLEEDCNRAVLSQEETVSFYGNGTTGTKDYNITKECMLFPDENKTWKILDGEKENETAMPDEKEWVDLGLPSGTLWAKCNVGATCESDYGLYFAYGETQGYSDASCGKSFSWADYQLGKGGSSEIDMKKYNRVDGKTTLELEDDAAYVASNGKFRIPTQDEFDELNTNTTVTLETINGVKGRKFTNKSDSSKYIFIPAAGWCNNGLRYGVGSIGLVWSSWLSSSYRFDAWYLYFDSDHFGVTIVNRCFGQSVRGVLNTSTHPA
jgi:hypothetical protein